MAIWGQQSVKTIAIPFLLAAITRHGASQTLTGFVRPHHPVAIS